MSDVGSIGITMSYLDNVEKNRKEGLNYVSLSTGKYKDYGNPDKSLTQEERALIERDLKIVHDEFVKAVAENRKLPVEDVAKLADGSSMPGTLALEKKLIDALGDQESARKWFAEQLEIPLADVGFCE
jgi:protease-4